MLARTGKDFSTLCPAPWEDMGEVGLEKPENATVLAFAAPSSEQWMFPRLCCLPGQDGLYTHPIPELYPYRTLPGRNVKGKTLATVLGTVDDCARACALHPHCAAFTRTTGQTFRKCHLKSTEEGHEADFRYSLYVMTSREPYRDADICMRSSFSDLAKATCSKVHASLKSGCMVEVCAGDDPQAVVAELQDMALGFA